MGAPCHVLSTGLRSQFESSLLEANFQRMYQPLATHGCYLWAALQVFYVVVSVIGKFCLPPLTLTPALWVLFGVPLVFAAALIGFASSGRVRGPSLNAALSLCYCATLAIHGVQYWLILVQCRRMNWYLPTPDPAARALLDRTSAYLVLIIFHVDQQLQLLPLLSIGFCRASVAAIAAGPIAMVLLTSLALADYPAFLTMAFATTTYAGVAVAFCRHLCRLRRSLFLAELQKTRHYEQVQHTDATVNHILKNVMVEASGLIDMFLELCTPPPPPDLVGPYLHAALERLRSGMAWCRRRGALLTLMADEARPTPRPTSLARLGTALTTARTMSRDFSPVVVELDDVLTDLMLENVLSNAFRHGHPTDPDVRFSIVAEALDTAATPGDSCPATSGDACRVTFRVTNRCDPKCQPLTAEQVRRLTEGGPASPSALLAEGSGLLHSFRAARLQGMAVSLAQVGGIVVFEASLETRWVLEEAPPSPLPPPDTPREVAALPSGLRIAVIDDSAAARTLLKHQLSRNLPGCVVDTFGASAADVDPFLAHALQQADVAILDQHLDWSSGALCLGTDLVRLLVQAGFPGLICIRSANTSEADLVRYVAAGAHCVLDKLLERSQTVAILARHYVQMQAARMGQPGARGPTPHSEPGTDMAGLEGCPSADLCPGRRESASLGGEGSVPVGVLLSFDS